MKAKQVLSMAFAVAMVFSTVPVTGGPVMAEEIDSDTIYIEKEVIDVTLPTTASQKFYIDPQGLIAIGKGGNAAANSGLVTGASDMYAVNRSSVPLALSVSYKLIDSAESGGVTVVNAVADADAVTAIKNDTTRKVAVSVSALESATDAASNGNDCGGKVFKAQTAGVDLTASTGGMTTADVVYADATTPATADYLMTAETYKAQLKDGKTAADAYDSSAYEYVVDTTAKKASCVKLTIGGYCSEKADWSDYADGTETLKLDVVFKFKKVTTTAGDYTDAKVGTDEAVQGPQIAMTAGGLVTITGLTAEKNITATTDVVVIDADNRYPFADATVTPDITGWSATTGGILKYQLNADWQVIDGDTVTVELTLSDGSKITSNSVTLNFNP